jgi:hypothetical protein
MISKDVLFVAGDVNRLASVKIRCREIASRLGCDCYYGALHASDVPCGYKAYVCVKPDFGPAGVADLAKRGRVIWDVLDNEPPTANVDVYVASTRAVARTYSAYGRVEVIPHYHCNFDSVPNCGSSRLVAYLGSKHWYPKIDNIDHKTYFADRWSREAVVHAYKEIGIAVNYRNLDVFDRRHLEFSSDAIPVVEKHIQINSGIKLINCLGFGIPSICSKEPAYLEISDQCALYGELFECVDMVKALKSDAKLYNELRDKCLALAPAFHVDSIVKRYAAMLGGI